MRAFKPVLDIMLDDVLPYYEPGERLPLQAEMQKIYGFSQGTWSAVYQHLRVVGDIDNGSYVRRR
jgi:hypothetical protein